MEVGIIYTPCRRPLPWNDGEIMRNWIECGKTKAQVKLVRTLVPTMSQELIMGDTLIVKIVTDDITAYAYVRSTLRPAIENVINNSNKEKI